MAKKKVEPLTSPFRNGVEPPESESTEECKNRWAKDASEHLKGRTIKEVRYMTSEEVETMGWEKASIVLVLDNGGMLFCSQDDEGNDAGAMFTNIEGLDGIPTI